MYVGKKDYSGIVMPSENNNILEITKSNKIPYIIYSDIESLIKKYMNVQIAYKIQTSKIIEHIPCGYAMSSTLALDHIENKLTSGRRKNFIKVL